MKHFGMHWRASEVEFELQQLVDEGKDLPPGLQAEAERLKAADYDLRETQDAVNCFLDATIALPTRPDYPYVEPSDLLGIRAARPDLGARVLDPHPADLPDRIHGAWLGRVCGCLLGKPAEGWRRGLMKGYLEELGLYPLRAYFRSDTPDEVKEKYKLSPRSTFADRVTLMPEDDDTNYTVTALAILRKHGYGFTPEDVADFWMWNIPIIHTCTAECIAYRNFVNDVAPPASASVRNPCREWIGAQIRADMWGYACPGDPARAAELAWRDACISHVKNGIYGEMWSAAMNSAALALDDPRAVIEAGLGQIPARCRLTEWVRRVIEWHEQGMGYDEAIDRIHATWNEDNLHHWCHTISNACIVTVALLWGGKDYGKSICMAVQASFDTDCNGATVGSIVGGLLGASRIPPEWSAPVNDTLETGVAGYHRVSISELAKQTLELARAS